MAQNPLAQNAVEAFKVPKAVYNAIKNAASATGVDFTYLMEKAAVESGFDSDAKSRSSSASGLYQFIESTWLKMVKDHGDKYGLEKYAAKIDDSGRVSDAKSRRAILSLRNDPQVASLMSAEFDRDNYNSLKNNVGGRVGATELYMAHFMGAGGASAFLNAMKKSPNMAAADIFPEAARANRNIFYDSKSGQPRSMKQVYAHFDRKFTDSPTVDQNQSVLSAQNNVVKQPARVAAAVNDDDAFARLGVLMAAENKASLLRLTAGEKDRAAQSAEQLRIFPQSMYGRLSLSPAQMMMLSDFSA